MFSLLDSYHWLFYFCFETMERNISPGVRYSLKDQSRPTDKMLPQCTEMGNAARGTNKARTRTVYL